MGNNTMSFERGLKRARKNAGYKTQEIFADSVQRSIDTVRNWEQGKNKPSLDDFMGLCEFLHCDADYLLDNLEVPTHELDFVCKYTGLSSEAVEELHKYADLEEGRRTVLDCFSEFIDRYYAIFLVHLADLKEGADSARGLEQLAKAQDKIMDYSTLKDLAIEQATPEDLKKIDRVLGLQKLINDEYVELQKRAYRFSRFWQEIPDALFGFDNILKTVSSRAALSSRVETKEDAEKYIKEVL